MTEAEKQQALCMKETEKNALQEKLNNAQQVIRDLEVELEKMKRNSSSKHEKDRVRNKYTLCVTVQFAVVQLKLQVVKKSICLELFLFSNRSQFN